MSTIDASRYVDLLRPGLMPIAGAQDGVCGRCRSGANSGFTACYRCDQVGAVDVLPISMSVHGGPLHHRLRHYKDDTREERRNEYTLQLAALLSKFLGRHMECIGGEPEAVTTVRSARRDAPRRIVRRIQSLRDLHVALDWVGGDERIRFSAPAELKGRRVLLVDDTFTQGRSITAAREALIEVGAHVMMPLVIGRHFRPGFATSRPLHGCLSRYRWRLRRCGICKPVECPGIVGPATLL
ncbi:MAG: hypothetical protein OXH86_09570 [Acidimicrobiaceae bacterium]|nr:hypothetical protein [Acidimicrobiaceae bacterium]